MISIVTGFMRSGTSCIMQALIAGGMSAVYSEERNLLANNHADDKYHPNPGGLYEIELTEYDRPNFPLMYDQKLIKVMYFGMNNLPPASYRIIIMKRDPEEIRQSYEAFFGSPIQLVNYHENIEKLNYNLEKQGCDVITINYRDLIEQPRQQLERLIKNGWPIIDLDRAEKVIDHKQYRFKKETLIPGA